MPPSSPPYHHGDLRRALVTGAGDILEADGMDALSLRSVAARAGVSHNAPYRHFPDRAALLSATAALGFDDLADRLATAGEAGDPDQAMSATGLAYVRFALARPQMYRLMFSGDLLKGASDPEYVRASTRAFDLLRTAVERLLPAAGQAGSGAVASILWAEHHGLALLLIEKRIRPWMRSDAREDDLVGWVAATLPGRARTLAALACPTGAPGSDVGQPDFRAR